jgi:hypothetical protein
MIDDNLQSARETYQRAIEAAAARYDADGVADDAARRHYERKRAVELADAAREIAAEHRLTVRQLLALMEPG